MNDTPPPVYFSFQLNLIRPMLVSPLQSPIQPLINIRTIRCWFTRGKEAQTQRMLDIRGGINCLHASQRIFSFSHVIKKEKITSFLPLLITYYLRFVIFWIRAQSFLQSYGCTRGMKLKNNRLPRFSIYESSNKLFHLLEEKRKVC